MVIPKTVMKFNFCTFYMSSANPYRVMSDKDTGHKQFLIKFKIGVLLPFFFQQYSNCSCVSASAQSSEPAAANDDGTAVPGYCRDGCDSDTQLYYFIGISGFFLMATTLVGNPIIYMTLR